MFLAFLNEFDPDLKETFLDKVRVLWTHGSTGLEGNTLTLGETHAVLSQGLTTFLSAMAPNAPYLPPNPHRPLGLRREEPE